MVWRSIKQSCIADSTMEAEYVAACEAAKVAVVGSYSKFCFRILNHARFTNILAELKRTSKNQKQDEEGRVVVLQVYEEFTVVRL